MVEGQVGGFWGSTWRVQTQLGILKRGRGGGRRGAFRGAFTRLFPGNEEVRSVTRFRPSRWDGHTGWDRHTGFQILLIFYLVVDHDDGGRLG